MGQLATEIQQAMDDKRPPVTNAMLKEAEPTLDFDALRTQFAGDDTMKDFMSSVDEGLPGLSPANASLQTALAWGSKLSIPASAIVAALVLRSHLKAEQRRKRLAKDYDTTERVSGKPLALAPSSFDVPVKAAMEKEAGVFGWPLAIAAALLGPAAFDFIKKKTQGMGLGEWAGNLLQPVGDDPLTHPLGPSVVVGTPVIAAALTHKLLGSKLDDVRKSRMEREREKAEQEFEGAMQAEYQGSKAAGLVEKVDELAERYVSLTKKATRDPGKIQQARRDSSWTGKGGMGIGLLVLASLMLTGAAGIGGYQWAKSSDKGRKRSDALERLARRRALSSPATMTAVTRPGEEETIAEEPI